MFRPVAAACGARRTHRTSHMLRVFRVSRSSPHPPPNLSRDPAASRRCVLYFAYNEPFCYQSERKYNILKICINKSSILSIFGSTEQFYKYHCVNVYCTVTIKLCMHLQKSECKCDSLFGIRNSDSNFSFEQCQSFEIRRSA